MTAALPETSAVQTRLDDGVLWLTLSRPEVKNAMNAEMIDDIVGVFAAIRDRRDVRAVVLRGAGGNFCAGGDVKDMAASRAATWREGEPDPVAAMNRRFGTVMLAVDRAPQAVVVVLEGAVLGGGFGLACVADVAIARADARFGLPETGLGLPPAQIAAFLVRRLGLSEARRLAVTGGRFDGEVAARIGLVHAVAADDHALERELAAALAQIRRCAPGAIAATKHIMAQVGAMDLERVLDEAAAVFATAVRGPEGSEGTMAFLQKRKPAWADGTDR
ncbi:MAG: enoyl-CoA hydratase/isomerase family protein [Deltaproteobacteria bacterium]|nr:enoyl-CoA hydratase/isomerase family protein [Deltaproteobacteria bacterium]MBK8717475.1 enoyl-CoA hydratase/isomerase family protein [Deltaproteobacteria bacterium]